MTDAIVLAAGMGRRLAGATSQPVAGPRGRVLPR